MTVFSRDDTHMAAHSRAAQTAEDCLCSVNRFQTADDFMLCFFSEVPADCMQHIEMFHSKTWPDIKQRIITDTCGANGNVRILVCTSVAGIEVNSSSVYQVINFDFIEKH